MPKAQWSVLAVAVKSTQFTVSFNGQKVFDVDDSTFTGAGKVGVWQRPTRSCTSTI